MLGFALMLADLTGYAQFANFVTRKGDKLYDGDQELRFISFNTPNLHYIEDNLPFSSTAAWRLPDDYEIRDALTAIRQLGGKVTRMYVLSVRREDDPTGVIRHVEGPGQFNEEAFRAIDKVLQVANEVGVRIMFGFVDNWRWWGGPQEYAAFRGKSRDDFWTDPQLIADFEATIKFTINRKNTYTGIVYRDDKAIFSWETGNEIMAPFSWSQEIARYVKSLDTNHLLANGTNVPLLSEDAIDDPNLDIVTTHHYRDPKVSIERIVANAAMARGRKPYLVGEYGIVPLQDIRAITDTIINQGLVGGMIWSLRVHNREGGFYHHYEYNNAEAYRWPGFESGDVSFERPVLAFLRDRAYKIDGTLPPPVEAPRPPLLLDIQDPARISWQGSTGADAYTVEREEDGTSDWQIVAKSVDESRLQYCPVYNDESVEPGKKYLYRVRAFNESGSSDYSNVVGPVDVTARVLIDNMEDFAKVFQKDGDLRLLTIEDIRRAKEDRSRLTGADNSYVMYKTPAGASSLRVEWLKTGPDAGIDVTASKDLVQFSAPRLTDEVYHFQTNDYKFYDAQASSVSDLPPGIQYIRIALKGGVQIGRVEITYDRNP